MKVFKIVKSYFTYLKHRRILKKVYKDEDMVYSLSQLFSSEWDMDWVCRLYTVFNSVLIQSSENPFQLEYTAAGANIDSAVDKWFLEKLEVVNREIKNKDLFDLVTYEVKKLDSLNYLFIIEPVSWVELVENVRSVWSWLKWLLGGSLIGMILYLFFHFL